LLKEKDDLHKGRLDELRKEIAISVEQVERGQYQAYDETGLKTMLGEVKTEGRKKLTEQRKQRRK
jgi:hypothetical protein